MKDNNKKMFLGVIVVATLIIAIIGATFAFFSASGGSANNAVTANATTLANLGFTSSHSKIATNLVPVSSESPYFSRYPGIAASGAHSCLDDVGNQICSVYEFTVTNTASVAQTIYVSFVPSENTFDNMYFVAFNTSIASADYTVATGSSGSGANFVLTPQTTASNSTLGHLATKLTKNSTTAIDMPGLSTSLASGASVTYTILVWLQETGNSQNTEQGGVFKAGVNVTTGGNATGVTGILDGSSGGGNYFYSTSYVRGYINQTIPNGMTTYLTAASAIAAMNNLPFYLKLGTDNDNVDGIVDEVYVDFVVTSSMASIYSGMVVGNYTLKGFDNNAFDNNASILTTAFGNNHCGFSNNNTFFACYVPTTGDVVLGASIDNTGYVSLYNSSTFCQTFSDWYGCGDF